MKPAPERITTPDDLLRGATAWLASAVVQDLAEPLAALRANVQAARRLLARDCPDSPYLAATLADLLEDAGHLETVVTELRKPAEKSTPWGRLQPEREIAAAVSLLAGSQQQLVLESNPLAPRVSGQPGVIGAAALHLLLSLPAMSGRVVRLTRPTPARLLIEVVGNVGADASLTAPLHAAAAAAAVERLAGTLELDAEGGPRLEIPLEL